jgi:hypothetical protein
MTTFKKGDRVRVRGTGTMGMVEKIEPSALGQTIVWCTWDDGSTKWAFAHRLTADDAAHWHAFSRLSDALHRINVAARNGDTALITELAQAVEALADRAER